MKKIVIDGFELNEEFTNRLLQELKVEGVQSVKDLEIYLKDYWYTKDNGLKSHLLLSQKPKGRNFAIPFDEKQ